jgi:hypothetical protein
MIRQSFAPIAIAIAAAAALMLAASSSHALSVSSAKLSDLRITLADLDAGDAVAPSVTLAPDAYSVAQAFTFAPGANSSWGNQGTGPFAPVSAAGELEGTGGAASISGDPFGAGSTFASSAHGRPGDFGGGGLATVDTQPSGWNLLTLSPHTEIAFTGHAEVSWLASALLASAYGQMNLVLIENPLAAPIVSSRDEFDAGYFGNPVSLSGFAQDDLSVTYANTSNDAVVLAYAIFVESNASEVGLPLVPVPEPSGASLTLAGLVTAGWAAWRRRQGRSGTPTDIAHRGR